MSEITSLQNQYVKQLVKLRERRVRDKTNQYLIEGYRELSRADTVEIDSLFYSPQHFLGSNEEALIDSIKLRGAQIFRVTKEVFEKISYRDRPDGLIAIANKKPLTLSDLNLEASPFLLIVESIEKPGNLGTILRSSDAAGVDAVIICDRCTDIYNPNVVRASVGTLFTQPVIESTSEEVISFLKEKQISIVATTPHAETIFTQVDLTGPLAIAMGTEQLGLSDQWLKQADIKVKIPMKGVADSLNVASATTLILYEALRQKNA
ncbi:MAG: RNA methyltransferase [Simkaniaceae bacterium]